MENAWVNYSVRKKSFSHIVNDVIAKSDVILEVLDARMIDQTRQPLLEQEILQSGKRLIFVINKADLAPREYLLRKKSELTNAIFLSAKERDGIGKLREYIYKVAAKNKSSNKDIIVGVIGYPNTGKSSVINALKGAKSAAAVASRSGVTRGVQNIRISSRLMIFDTPGVIPTSEQNEGMLAILSAKNIDKLKDPDMVAAQLLESLHKDNPTFISEVFGVEFTDAHDTLEKIALKRHRIKYGGVADIDGISRMILQDWQRGKLYTIKEKESFAKKER